MFIMASSIPRALPGGISSLHGRTRALVLPEQAVQAVNPEPARLLLKLPAGRVHGFEAAIVLPPPYAIRHVVAVAFFV